MSRSGYLSDDWDFGANPQPRRRQSLGDLLAGMVALDGRVGSKHWRTELDCKHS